MYRVFYITPVRKDLKALSEKVRELVDNYFSVLAENPFVGKFLAGEFKRFLSYSFIYSGTEYRIIYQILKKKLVILVIMVGSRENIYKRLR